MVIMLLTSLPFMLQTSIVELFKKRAAIPLIHLSVRPQFSRDIADALVLESASKKSLTLVEFPRHLSQLVSFDLNEFNFFFLEPLPPAASF